MENLSLWESVEKTDTKYTKPATVNGRTFTSITPTYQQREATKAFGPRGIGWGVVPGSETFDYKEIGTTTLLVYKAVLFYNYGGNRGELPMGATEQIAYLTKGGKGYLKIDDEADKKVRTSAMSKALAELGFNADVFMGMFDDHDYKNVRDMESQIEHAENKEKAINIKLTECENWLKKEISAIQTMTNASVVTTVTNTTDNRLMQKLSILSVSDETKRELQQALYDAAQSTIDKLNNQQG